MWKVVLCILVLKLALTINLIFLESSLDWDYNLTGLYFLIYIIIIIYSSMFPLVI